MKNIRIAILLAVIVGVSFWVGSRYGGTQPGGSGTQNEREILYYVDPMTPGFRSDSPGTAPCGMPLEPVYADSDGTQASLPEGAIRVNPQRQQLIGVKLATVNQQLLTHTLRLYGQVVPDETRVFRINAAVDSWVRELSNVTTGSFVKKDQILAEVLSPSYYNAQVTYLLALNNMDRIKEQLGGELRHQQGEMANNSIRVSVQALQNLGITDAQVKELSRTRKARPYLQVRSPVSGFVLNRNITLNQWFKAAEEFYTIADIDKVWVYADVYENEARYLPPGTPVKVKHTQLGKTFDATVSEVLPLFDPVSKTLKVRMDIDNADFELRPDMFVDVEIPITMPSSLYVSADAIINTGMKEIIYVDAGDGVLEPRHIETGHRLGRWVEIVDGLMPGEKIVESGNFLVDSESRMRTAGNRPEGKTTKDLVCGMTVDQQAATDAGRILIIGDKTYYFCSAGCMADFHEDPESYLAGEHKSYDNMNENGQQKSDEPDDSTMATDLVCGMKVDTYRAELARSFVTIDETTYYFCSKACMLDFVSNFKKYAKNRQPVGQEIESADMSKMIDDHEKKMAPTHASKMDQPQPKVSYKPTKDVGKQSLSNPGVIDWDETYNKNNDVSQDWPKGWGEFPGAKYLGTKDNKQAASNSEDNNTAQHNDTTEKNPPDKDHMSSEDMKGHSH